MGCELSKSARPKAPKYKTYQTRHVDSDYKRVNIADSIKSSRLNPDSEEVVDIDERREISVKEDGSISCLTELQLDLTKETMLVHTDDVGEDVMEFPADHVFDDESLPLTGPLERVDGSMFDEEVLTALSSFEHEQMLRKDFEFAAILAHIQGA